MNLSAETKTTSVAVSRQIAARLAEIADICQVNKSVIVTIALAFGVNVPPVHPSEPIEVILSTEITVDLQERLTLRGDVNPEHLGRICAAGLQKADDYCVRLTAQIALNAQIAEPDVA